METIFVLDKLTEDGGAWFKVHVPNYKEIERYLTNGIATGWVMISDNRRLSPGQRKKWFALVRDISIYTGYPVDYLHTLFKTMYSIYYDKEQISMSNTDMTTAKDMIDFLLNWCFDFGIPLAEDTGKLFQGEELWTYKCLEKRICTICGKKSDKHHALGSKVGMGNNRNKIDNVGREFLPLCRKHHSMIEAGSELKFYEKYHLKPIRLNENQVKELKL